MYVILVSADVQVHNVAGLSYTTSSAFIFPSRGCSWASNSVLAALISPSPLVHLKAARLCRSKDAAGEPQWSLGGRSMARVTTRSLTRLKLVTQGSPAASSKVAIKILTTHTTRYVTLNRIVMIAPFGVARTYSGRAHELSNGPRRPAGRRGVLHTPCAFEAAGVCNTPLRLFTSPAYSGAMRRSRRSAHDLTATPVSTADGRRRTGLRAQYEGARHVFARRVVSAESASVGPLTVQPADGRGHHVCHQQCARPHTFAG